MDKETFVRFGVSYLAFTVLSLFAALFASVPMTLPSGIERLSNGNTLITESGSMSQPNARVIEVDSTGRLVWAYVRSDIQWAHTARRTAGGNTLISATDSNRVLEVDARGDVIWEMRSGLDYPNEAFRLANGNTLITVRDADRVIEVDSARNVVWSYSALVGPHNGSRLANGNTLICNSEMDQVIEVDSAGAIRWQYANGLDWARCAERLPNGNTLIADSRHNRVIEVDSAGATVWTFSSGISLPYMATRLPTGTTLISAGARVVEVDSSGATVWQYPPASSAVVVETLWVTNPTSGCSLYVHIHRPAYAGPDRKVPAVVLIPRENGAGTVMDQNGLADQAASDGFAVLHFDADGRGLSSGVEDYNGHVQQDGLRACVLEVASRAYVDTANLGIYTRGYGVVMATGMAARHSQPRVKFLMDLEGPSDRYQTSSDSGGHVPVPVDSEAFWLEREAGNFIRDFPGAYLRVQTETDYTDRIPDNHHAIALIDSATAAAHGGSGVAAWTRVNDSVANPANRTYTVADPPTWIAEQQERHNICRELLYLHELADGYFPGAISTRTLSLTPCPSPFSVSPNPCRGSTVLHWSTGQPGRSTTLRIFDASGRLLHSTSGIRTSSFELRTSSFAAGVYLLRLDSDGRFATARLVVN
ncbi:T9SS type A sorting domain-containing protein [candidate division WOR-3 bacterium]|uniref:T9SS type A sorting domain-containing protein n=1 Tax=candidate division WOR-3 bacterium TaxID=2052148 RepID=A0A938BT96_UNCW3|nr:T9SS type A sorting domain-containing protein [candidate division WOR-3 bacterium]